MFNRSDIETALTYMESNNLIRLGRSTSKWQQLYCPFHNDGQERKPSCGCLLEEETKNGVTYHAGFFNCFACGAKYDLGQGIREILKLKGTSLTAHPVLAKYVNDIILNDETHSLIPSELMTSMMDKYATEDVRSVILSQKKTYVSEEELASYRYTVPYMYERKLTDAVIEKYDVGYDANFVPPGRKKPLPCVTFPVRDVTGRTLFFCRRSIKGKFFNYPEGVEKPVYGLYELPKNCKEVIICESVFNALTAVVYGRPAVALLGTGNQLQISQLKRLGVNSFVICLDPDEAGRKGTEKLKKALSSVAFVWVMHVPEGKDANDLTYEEFENCYNNKD